MNPNNDEQHLQLLAIFHYVHAGMTALVSCFPIFHFAMGVLFIITSLTQPQDSAGAPGIVFGLLFAGVSGSIILLGWVLAACIALAGLFIQKRTRYIFCLVLAGIQCIFTPWGTILGVFTIVVLVRPSVKALFMPPTPEISETI